MALLRKSDTIDLKSRVLQWKTAPRPVRQSTGQAILLRRQQSDSAIFDRSYRRFDTHADDALKKARTNLVRFIHARREVPARAFNYIEAVERHTGGDGTLYPERPDFFFKKGMGARDMGRRGWFVPQRNGARGWKKSSLVKDAPTVMWRKMAIRRMKRAARAEGVDLRGEKLGGRRR